MAYTSPYETFIFESYTFDKATNVASFNYSFDKQVSFTETIKFAASQEYNEHVLERALQLAHIIVGISYYKTFPSKRLEVQSFSLNTEQAHFFSTVYRDGLSQFIFENGLSPDDIAHFEAGGNDNSQGLTYDGKGSLVLQSGGKDSLLLAQLLNEREHTFDALYVTSSDVYPSVLNIVDAAQLRLTTRHIDYEKLQNVAKNGALNGHVPITFIIVSLAVIQAILLNKSTVLMAIGQEGEEPHEHIGDFPIRHQWSKTWRAETMFAEYVTQFISNSLQVGSPLRSFSELKVTKLFAEHCWERYGASFSSCNVANYGQGHDNTELTWCGNCSKCANSFLLFAPFVLPLDLQSVFGANLFEEARLQSDFEGLLGIGDATKPFECVGEIDELRAAYHKARRAYPSAGYALPFDVPASKFDMERDGPSQPWASAMLQ